MTENFHLFFTLFCIAHLWILAAILLLNKSNRSPNRLLALFLVLFSFIHIQHAFLQTGYLDRFPYFDPLCGITICLAFPIFLFYVRSLTGTFKLSDRRNWLHLGIIIPAIINLGYLLAFKRSEELKAYYYQEAQRFTIINALLLGGMALLLLFYLLLSIKTIKDYSCKLKNNFSNIDKLRIDWLHQLIGCLLALALVVAPVLIIIGLPEWNRIGMGLYTSIMYVGMMYKTLQHPMQKTELQEQNSKSISIQLASDKEDLLLNQLRDYLHKSKPYLNPQLSLKQLSAEVGIQPYLVSYLINKNYQKTFFDLINGLRVKEAMFLLIDPLKNNLTIEALAEESGFGSKTTFNKVFKEVTGQTPSQYRKQHMSELQLSRV